MIHSTTRFNLQETQSGEMIIPSEKGNITAKCNFRQFLIQNNRNYTQEALANIAGMNVRVNKSVDLDVFNPSCVNSLVLVDILVQPKSTLEDFVEESGDEFFDELLSVLGTCDMRGIRGNRAVFVSEFSRKQLADGCDVLAAKIVLSTSVFYNDYRATVGYPSNQEELDTVVENIYNRISNRFPQISFEASGEFEEETEEA